MSFDVLQEKIIEKKNPTVAGLDPKPEQIPPHILQAAYHEFGENLMGAAEAVWQFNRGLIDALCDVVPAVKPQAAYYERLGWSGLAIMDKTIRYAREKGLFVIADIKRGDIGSTAQAYADAWLGETQVGGSACSAFDADCVTLNGYMGSDTVAPFVDTCKKYDKCLFLLAKTSNPGSGELQNLTAGDRLVYQLLGDMAEKLGAGHRGQVRLRPGRRGHRRHLAGGAEGAPGPPAPHLLPGARLRRPGRHRRGRAARLRARRARGHRQRLPVHHVRLAEDGQGREGLPGGRPGRRRGHAGRHWRICDHPVI